MEIINPLTVISNLIGDLLIIIMNKNYYVYILGNNRPTIYIGVTNKLIKRIYQHKNSLVDGFSKKYGLSKLLYFEKYNEIYEAIKREKQIKKWNRKWKLDLIKKANPYFKDIYPDLYVDSRSGRE